MNAMLRRANNFFFKKMGPAGFFVFLLVSSFSWAQERTEQTQAAVEDQPLGQDEFAVELIRLMDLEEFLPKAAVKQDCVDVLEQFGIAPLKGWQPHEFLREEDYLVLIAKASGKESVVYQRAWQVEQKNVEIIHERWQIAFEEKGEWPPLEVLLEDSHYFPNGVPPSPFGRAYTDRNRDHQIDSYFPPVLGLDRLRKTLSAQ